MGTDEKDPRDLPIESWMRHDSRWFGHTVDKVGIEDANEINLAAARCMGAIEIRRLCEALEIDEVKKLRELRLVIETAWSVLRTDFEGFEVTWPAPNIMRWKTQRCFAFEGVTALGLIGQYECPVAERVEAWFDALGVKYSVRPFVAGCMMHEHGRCAREYSFALEA